MPFGYVLAGSPIAWALYNSHWLAVEEALVEWEEEEEEEE